MKVCIAPYYSGPDRSDGGIRRVVEAQIQYLPDFGIQTTDDPTGADLIVCHGATLVEQSGVPMIAGCHGLMWESYPFGEGGEMVNKRVIDVLTRAQAITAPSRWVAHAISRGMLARPEVIYHGVDAVSWAHTEPSLNYVLWNKARTDPVSDPRDMNAVARLLPGVRFVSTFGQPSGNVLTIGAMTYDDMRPIVQRAGVYLATARETFGIGTLEALAAGVPVAGWRYGGQEEIIAHGETGYLAEYGDYEELAGCIRRCLSERDRLSKNCVADVSERWQWRDKIAQYAALYEQVVEAWKKPRPKVSVVITCHNLGRYLDDALGSVARQTLSDWECLIIDDASTDDTGQVAERRVGSDKRFKYLPTPQNLKLSGARNYGWQQANGRYILFLDADDRLAANALDTLSVALDRDTALHIAYGHLDTISEDGQNQQRNPWPPAAFNWHAQIAHLNQLPYAAMLRREVLERSGGYRSRDWRAEDASLWTRLTSFGFRAAKVTEDTTLIYRLRSDSKGMTERAQYADGDGDWTAWYPWRLAGNAQGGLAAMQERTQPNYAIVPFGAQGTPSPPHRAWPVRHHQHPLVSVIIPVGPGHAKYLPDALDSVLAQTLPDWEAIVVNDTGEPIDLKAWPWARTCVQTQYLASPLGAGGARNWGLAHAGAPLVAFLDADDILVPRALELMARAYTLSEGRYVYGDCVTLEDEARLDGPATLHAAGDYDPQRMLRQLYHAVTALIPAEHVRGVGGFNEQLSVFEDWDLYCKLAVSGVCGVRVPQPLLIVRRHGSLRTRQAMQPRAESDAAPRYTALGEATAEAILDRYANYRSGEESIMGCCGGNAPIIQQAGHALDRMLGAMGLETQDVASLAPIDPNAPVRMEYIGDEWGEQTYIGKVSGLQYRAGRDPGVRYHDIDGRDAQHFVDLGKFRIVPNLAEPR